MRPHKRGSSDFVKSSAEHRRVIVKAISEGPFLAAVKGMTSEGMRAMAEREFVKLGVDAKVLSVENMPTGSRSRLHFRIIFSSVAEYVDFDPGE